MRSRAVVELYFGNRIQYLHAVSLWEALGDNSCWRGRKSRGGRGDGEWKHFIKGAQGDLTEKETVEESPLRRTEGSHAGVWGEESSKREQHVQRSWGRLPLLCCVLSSDLQID